MPVGIHREIAEPACRPAGLHRFDPVSRHRSNLRTRGMDTCDSRFGCLAREFLGDLVVGPLAQLEHDLGTARVEADAEDTSAEQWLAVTHGPIVIGVVVGCLGEVTVDAFEELEDLGGEQANLLLLEQDRENLGAARRLNEETSLAGLTERTGAESVDVVEVDDVRHGGALASAGISSSSEPVSLHFVSITPNAWNSNTVTDAGDTCTRWNRSRCTPV